MLDSDLPELADRLKILLNFENSNRVFFHSLNKIDCCLMYMFDYIDDLRYNLNVLVPERMDCIEMGNYLKRIKSTCYNITRHLNLCLSDCLDISFKLRLKLHDFDMESTDMWWTLASRGRLYENEFCTLLLEIDRVQMDFNENIKRYSELYGF